MEHIIKRIDTKIWTVRPKENENGLSEGEVKIMESGFPNKYLVIFENAYGELSVKRMTAKQISRHYGIVNK